MQANQVKPEAEVKVLATQPIELVRELEAVRELSALELSLVGGGTGIVAFT